MGKENTVTTEAELLGMAMLTLCMFRDWAAKIVQLGGTGMYSKEDQVRAWSVLATLRDWEAMKKAKGE